MNRPVNEMGCHGNVLTRDHEDVLIVEPTFDIIGTSGEERPKMVLKRLNKKGNILPAQ